MSETRLNLYWERNILYAGIRLWKNSLKDEFFLVRKVKMC